MASDDEINQQANSESPVNAPSEESIRDAVRVLLSFIPDQQRDEEYSNSSEQRNLLEDIRWTTLEGKAAPADDKSLQQFNSIMARQNQLIEEIQKRTRMLVGV